MHASKEGQVQQEALEVQGRCGRRVRGLRTRRGERTRDYYSNRLSAPSYTHTQTMPQCMSNSLALECCLVLLGSAVLQYEHVTMTQGSSEVNFRRLGVQRIGSDEEDQPEEAKATEITAFKQEGPSRCFYACVFGQSCKTLYVCNCQCRLLNRRRRPSKGSGSPCCSGPIESRSFRAPSRTTNPALKMRRKPRSRSPAHAVTKAIQIFYAFQLLRLMRCNNVLHNIVKIACLMLLRSMTSLECAIDILHSEYEKVATIRAQSSSRKLNKTEETELRDCKVGLLY